ncbi:MAG: S-methyl-5-thioribose-1-phosphate isomerase [Candidatus Bilamarchaeaceae archaeon]
MHAKVSAIARDIKSLKIQGARNIAKAAVQALFFQISISKAKSLDAIHREALSVGALLAKARPTEPMARNYVKQAIFYSYMLIKAAKAKSVPEFKEMMAKEGKTILAKMDADKEMLVRNGERLIQKGAVVMTHCHSSTVTGILIRAHRKKKNISVISLETRPRFQGRITAKELADYGVDVTSAVDGSMNMLMRKADMVLVGADAITSRGDLINKVGTSTLAHIASMHDKSFYSAAELYKYDPLTLFGSRERIEERDRAEVWPDSPKKVKVRNPAFDVTAAKYITAFITDGGVIPPESLFTIAEKKLKVLE